MKYWTLLIPLIGFAAFAEDYRSFTSQDGRALKAKMLSYDVTTGKVQIEREDKKKLTVGAEAFSEKDRAFFTAWLAAREFQSTSKLKLDLTRDEVKVGKKEHEADLSEIKLGKGDGKRDGIEVIATDKITQYKYDLTIENKGSVPLKNVIFEYRVFYEQEKPVNEKDEKRREESGREDADERVRHNALNESKVKDGAVRLKPIAPKESKEVSTATVNILQRTVGKPYQDKINLKGSLIGAWVRLTMKGPDGETLVREIASPASIMKKFPWNPEEAQE